ncbi:unnamed protein product [Urochloa humidicola]
MDCKELCAANLTNDLVVEILSRLPFKSFSRFKCVCKAWHAFSFDPHYSQKLPKVPTGFLYQDRHNSAIQLVSLSERDEGIDGSLSFLPGYEHLELVDCCNGLVLCEYRSNYTSPDIFRFVVCNPTTREWRILPDTQRKANDFYYTTKLGFNPSQSRHFYVFNFQQKHGVCQVEMFASCKSMWLVDSDLWDPENYDIFVSGRPHVFIDGFLHVHTDRDVLVLGKLEPASMGIPTPNWTIELPLHRIDCFVDHCFRGCLGQYAGILHYTVADQDGCTILVWSHDYYDPDVWTVRHRLSMRDAFGRDDFVHYEDGWIWTCDYEIIAFDLERDAIFLVDGKTNKLLSYGISTGKLNEIKDSSHCYMYYVPCYLKLPDPESDMSSNGSLNC